MITAQNFRNTEWFHNKPKKLNVKPHYEHLFHPMALRRLDNKKIIGFAIEWVVEIYAGKIQFLGYKCMEDFITGENIDAITDQELWKALISSYEKFKDDFEKKTASVGLSISAPFLASYNITLQECIYPVLRD